jgi:tetratricopeptide (TPR) repeat protein
MRQTILAGMLVLASCASVVMAQPKPPAPKSKEEGAALMALFGAQSDPDATIKNAEDLLTKYSDTDFKDTALLLEARAYQMKGDQVKAQIYATKTLEVNPHSFQASLMLGELIMGSTHENDLDKEERLTKAEKSFHQAMDDVSAATKPNPQVTDQQWDEAKKSIMAEAHSGLGLIALSFRKKYDVAITEFKTAGELDPQPAYEVRLASANQASGKNDEAIAIADKVLAAPNLDPRIKTVAQSVKNDAVKAKAAAKPPAPPAPGPPAGR